MEIRHLQQLLMIAQQGSINKAAQVLFLSQPSLNNQVKRCEEELGFSLFYRSPKGIELSEKGKLFMHSAQKIIEEYQRIEALKENTTLSLSFLYLSYFMEVFLKLQEEGTLFSGLIRRIRIEDVIEDVCLRNVHLGILPVYTEDKQAFFEIIKEKNMKVLPLFSSVQVYAVLSKKHPLASKQSLSFNEIKDYPYVSYIESIPNSIIKNSFLSQNTLKVENRDEVFLALKNHRYISFFTLTKESINHDFVYLPIMDVSCRMDLYVLLLKNEKVSDNEKYIIQILKERIQFL